MAQKCVIESIQVDEQKRVQNYQSIKREFDVVFIVGKQLNIKSLDKEMEQDFQKWIGWTKIKLGQ